ncbi:MAG: MarR family winged helix-turn-helix transcriptional regulator [Candidatus Aquicultorales bacterium]
MDPIREHLLQDIMEGMTVVRRMVMSRIHKSMPFGEEGLPRAQGEVLFLIAHHEGISLKKIAEFLRISGSAVTQLVESLVKTGLVERESDPDDRRAVKICLSVEGRRKFDMVKAGHLEKIALMLSPLTNEELMIFRDLHKKIVAGHMTGEGTTQES